MANIAAKRHQQSLQYACREEAWQNLMYGGNIKAATRIKRIKTSDLALEKINM